MRKLENKIAVITGGNAGIGLATAQEFIAQGAKVVITGRRQEAIDSALQKLGSNAIGIRSDVTVLSDIGKLVEQVKTTFGKVDVLFVNAGVALQEPVGQITGEALDTLWTSISRGLFSLPKDSFPCLTMGPLSFI